MYFRNFNVKMFILIGIFWIKEESRNLREMIRNLNEGLFIVCIYFFVILLLFLGI